MTLAHVVSLPPRRGRSALSVRPAGRERGVMAGSVVSVVHLRRHTAAPPRSTASPSTSGTGELFRIVGPTAREDGDRRLPGRAATPDGGTVRVLGPDAQRDGHELRLAIALALVGAIRSATGPTGREGAGG